MRLYHMNVDVKSLVKIVYVATNDRLQIEFYKTKRTWISASPCGRARESVWEQK